MYVIMCNGIPEAVAFTPAAAAQAKKQLREAHREEWTKDKRLNYDETFTWKYYGSVKLALGMGVLTPVIPSNNADLMVFRREQSSGFATTIKGEVTKDYAQGLQLISTGLSHALESVPSGQLLRTRAAVESILTGFQVLVSWLASRNVFVEAKDGDPE